MLDWFAAHKDGVIAFAVLISPVTAIVSALVGFRAVIVGPRVQRQISEDQFKLTTRALELQEEGLALGRAQAAANLMRATDQEWAEAFRQTLAELQGLIYERANVVAIKEIDPEHRRRRLLELSSQATVLIAKLQLLTGVSDGEAQAFYVKMRDWAEERDAERVASKYRDIVELACRIMERRAARLASYMRPMSRHATPDDEQGSGHAKTATVAGKVVPTH